MAIDQKKDIARILNVVADLSELLSPRDFRELIHDLEFRAGYLRSRKHQSSVRENTTASVASYDEVISDLERVNSRYEGEKIIADAGYTKQQLTDIAKRLKVHVVKQDNMSRLAEKIIETLIGSRLSSQAIRGVHPNDPS